MKIFKYIGILLILVRVANAQDFRIQRVCTDNVENFIFYWQNIDTCNEFINYQLFGRLEVQDPFQVVNTGNQFTNPIQDIPSSDVRDWEYYLNISYRCGNDTLNLFSDTVEVDNQEPGISELDSVSVIDGNVHFGWGINPAGDLKGYYLYSGTGIQFRVFDTISGKFTIAAIDSIETDPTSGVVNFKMAAFDSCNRPSPLSIGTHSTIFLNGQIDTCTNSISLNWSGYGGWNVNFYRIRAVLESGNDTLLGETNSESLTLNNLPLNESLDLYIRAFKVGDSSVTSSSNRIFFRTGDLQPADSVYLNYVTVKDDAIEIKASVDDKIDVSSWRIYRKLSTQSTYSLYREENIDNNLIFRDLQANFNENIYDYQVEVIDVCNRITELSNRGRNILLESAKGDNSNELSFNFYQDWANGVASYEIYFSTDSVVDGDDRIGIIGNLENTFSHTPFIEDTVVIFQCYYVEAIANPVGSNNDTSTSNLSCEFEEAIVFIPNAIRIEGRNRVFKPVGLNYVRNAGSLKIFNRWGQEIFSSDNPEKGWDGSFNGTGDFVDEGLYLYFMSLEGTDGNTYYFNGEINVIK